MTDTAGLTQLGAGPRNTPGAALEAFPIPSSVALVELATNEVVCRCPLTQQPDIYRLVLRYRPNPNNPQALETKTVKLWLWGYMHHPTGMFAEALAADILDTVLASVAAPAWCEAVLVQNVRGGITTTVTAEGAP